VLSVVGNVVETRHSSWMHGRIDIADKGGKMGKVLSCRRRDQMTSRGQ
jgi:hypothetical protein